MKITRCGLDIAKQVFQVHGVNEHGVVKGRFSRCPPTEKVDPKQTIAAGRCRAGQRGSRTQRQWISYHAAGIIDRDVTSFRTASIKV